MDKASSDLFSQQELTTRVKTFLQSICFMFAFGFYVAADRDIGVSSVRRIVAIKMLRLLGMLALFICNYLFTAAM